MILQSTILQTSQRQWDTLSNSKHFVRELLPQVHFPISDFAVVISGVRRCGKSVLMAQLASRCKAEHPIFYLNFDAPQLYGFTYDDYQRLDDAIRSYPEKPLLFLDEVQVVEGWELYVRGKLDEGNQVVVSGSNASMLSRELGTKLTGRHLSYELFPFSYKEFCGFLRLDGNETSQTRYMEQGGFPLYLKLQDEDILNNLLSDILYRDVTSRYGVRDYGKLKELLMLLLNNVGNMVSANKLRQVLQINSATTVNEYFSYLQQSYLFDFVPVYSASEKVRMVNPKKVYCVDTGLITVCSTALSANIGHRLENMVYGELRRRYKSVYYFNHDGHECDFVAMHNNRCAELVQVCADFNTDTYQREVQGLLAAMEALSVNQGSIVTLRQTDSLIESNKHVRILPFHQWALNDTTAHTTTNTTANTTSN